MPKLELYLLAAVKTGPLNPFGEQMSESAPQSGWSSNCISEKVYVVKVLLCCIMIQRG